MRSRILAALTAGAVTAGLLALGGTPASGTGNKTCPGVTHRDTTGWTAAGAATATLHTGKGIVLKTTASNDDKLTWTAPAVKTGLKQTGPLSYQTETQTGHTSAAALPSYFLSVDVNDDGTADTKLIFEPYYQVTGNPSGATTNWDVDGGKFWSNSGPDKPFMSGWPLNEKAGGSYAGNKTLAEIAVLWPAGKVLGYGINLGTYNPGVVARVNDVRFGCVKHEWLPALPSSPSPSASQSQSPSPSPSVSLSPSPSVSPSASASVSPSASVSLSPSAAVPPLTDTNKDGKIDCKDTDKRNFKIDPKNDPHNLDGDNDGIACEDEVIVIPADNSDDLPNTGSQVVLVIWAGLALLVAGIVFMVVLRRRKTRFIA